MVFDAFMEVISIRRHWPWWSLWGRKLLSSLVSLTKLPTSHQGLLFYLLYLSSLEFWHWFSVHHMSPSSSMRIQLPAATAKCSGVSFVWENGGSVKGVCLPSGKLQSCSTCFLCFCWWQDDWGKDPLVRSGIRSCSGFL